MTAPTRIDPALLAAWPLPSLAGGADKEKRGSVLVIAGSAEMPGAAVLAAEATLRAGAGKLEVAVPKAVANVVAAALPEARVTGFTTTKHGGPAAPCVNQLAQRLDVVDAVLVGPGMSDPDAVTKLVHGLCEAPTDARIVLDAAALTSLHDTSFRFPRPVVVTPHPGEMAKITHAQREAVEADPMHFAEAVAKRANALVLLKSVATHVAAPDGRLWIYQDGDEGLGMSGSGDVLAGILTGLLARGADLVQAAAWAVALHGAAGVTLRRRVGPLGYLARELAACVPQLLEQLPTASR